MQATTVTWQVRSPANLAASLPAGAQAALDRQLLQSTPSTPVCQAVQVLALLAFVYFAQPQHTAAQRAGGWYYVPIVPS